MAWSRREKVRLSLRGGGLGPNIGFPVTLAVLGRGPEGSRHSLPSR